MKYVQLGHDDRRTCDSYTGKDPAPEGKPMPHPQPQVIGMFGCQKTIKNQQTTNPPRFPVPGNPGRCQVFAEEINTLRTGFECLDRRDRQVGDWDGMFL